MTMQRIFTSRAVLRQLEPGPAEYCAGCGERVAWAPPRMAGGGRGQRKVVANVYSDGVWQRVEHWHEDHYLAAGEPYGKAVR